MRVAVTGGGGFIGSNLVRRLIDIGMSVVVLDDFSTGDRRNLDGCEAELMEGSILDRNAVDAALNGAEGVIHLAALPSVARSVADPMTTHHVNVTGTLEVLQSARSSRVSYVVVASSSSVYGANRMLPKSEDLVPMPMSPYAVSKLASESYALACGECYGLDVLALRFFNVYGPFQRAGHSYAAVIPAFIAAALAGEPLIIHGDGHQTRDFTYVGSVESVLVEALQRRLKSSRPVNLAFGTRTSLLGLIAELEEVFGHSLRRQFVEPRIGDVSDSQADSSRLATLIPEVAPMSLREGLLATVEWFKNPAKRLT